MLRLVSHFCCFIVLAGCFRRSPHGTAERYVEGLQQFNYAKCYSLLSTQIAPIVPCINFLRRFRSRPTLAQYGSGRFCMLCTLNSAMSIATPTESSAYVPVRVTTLDLSSMGAHARCERGERWLAEPACPPFARDRSVSHDYSMSIRFFWSRTIIIGALWRVSRRAIGDSTGIARQCSIFTRDGG